MTLPNSSQPPADQEQRDQIRTSLDVNILVEAAAGTGKTTCLISRMVELLAQGECAVETLAAVTFTRKAAAEMRTRFQIELEKRARESTAPEKERLSNAINQIERGFIGTIHSFCARLLRERPVEAGVDLSFRELDEAEDRQIRENAWEEYAARLYVQNDPILCDLTDTGLDIGKLKEAYIRLADYPDVPDWPAPPIPLPDLQPTINALQDYVHHIETLLPDFPKDPGNDKLMAKYRLLARLVRFHDPAIPVELMAVLDGCSTYTIKNLVQKHWPQGSDQARTELERWNQFVETYVAPNLAVWYAHRYAVALRAILPALGFYEQQKRELGGLNFQDLLMKTAVLLRRYPSVRSYFRRRFTHLLVDEFQDTDPIQAEVMLLLTGDDETQQDWRLCRPRPGSLFVVGDPKQSIYRFRRADIVTYNQVKSIIQATGGQVIQLYANFRTTKPILDWVNTVFQRQFPAAADPYSPSYIHLHPGKSNRDEIPDDPIQVLNIPANYSNKEDCVFYEAETIARRIRWDLDRGIHKPEDFMIVTQRTRHLSVYADYLQTYGIPHQVTGGSALNQVRELDLLALVLDAVSQPENPIPLVGLLRSELFGVSDVTLYAFKSAGGRFSYRNSLPVDLQTMEFSAIRDAYSRLRRYTEWLDALPPVPALEKIVADLGLFALAGTRPGASIQCGSLAKALELLRSYQTEFQTVFEMAVFLKSWINQEETYDGISAAPVGTSVVRVMNLHKVKGLESSIVFLADATGESSHEVDLHIDRSGKNAVGYLPIIHTPPGGFRGVRLAHPLDWDQWAAVEKQFLDAEKIRLMYVAATRAKVQLIISQREKGNHQNPWNFFADYLTTAPRLPEPESPAKPRVESVPPDEPETSAALANISTRWSLIMKPTYELRAAKPIDFGAEKIQYAEAETDADWGSVIHLLLKTMMEKPHSDLSLITTRYLTEWNIDRQRKEEAIQTVKTVMASELWSRAAAGIPRYVEIPFTLQDSPPNANETLLPVLLRGIIDLVFRESQGWVIVDYKTSSPDDGRINSLLEIYRPQMENYIRAWRTITGEPIQEAGWFFTKTGQYVKVSI